MPQGTLPRSAFENTQSSVRAAGSDFLWRWGLVTLAGAVLLSTIDALLLQRDKSFFTGGFLSVDHLAGASNIAAFLVVSLIVDAAVVGLVAAVVMWVLCRWRVRATACVLAGFLAGVGPMIAADIISYELVRHLGEAADLSLMLELAGGSVSELFAVAAAHLVVPGLLLACASGAVGGLVWIMHRWSAGAQTRGVSGSVLYAPALVCLAALTISTTASASSDAMENGLRRKPAGGLIASLVDDLSDVDRDGFGIAGRMSDPNPFDASIFPYAIDIPGNGIDENGVGGDLPEDAPPYVETPLPSTAWTRRPDVVLVVLESFRADLLGSSHRGGPVTPVLNALGSRGISSSRAYSHNGYTAQSRYHLLSGSLAGVRDRSSLIDDFKAQGYLTAYFSGQDESFGSAEYRIGFERADVAYDARVDFARRYSTFTTAGSLAVPFALIQERIREFLGARGAARQPIFLYVNFHDTHFPYTHDGVEALTSPVRLARHRIVPGERDALWGTYANTAANVDRAVGEVLDNVRRARGSEPAVIVTADHGESLFDEGFLGHGYALNDVQTRIPLVVANLPMIVQEPFAQRDLREAIGAALRVPADAPLLPQLRRASGRKVFQYLGNVNRPRQVAFLRDSHRIIYDFRSQRVQIPETAWRRPDDLAPAERAEFLRLIHEWERMNLARQSLRGSTS
jgi:glucan phosphoethanolaminetransferase (alkaline phosphatase superfamily)